MRIPGFAWIAALTVLLVALVAPGPALAGHVQCGDVITQNTKLDSDVVCTGGTQDALTGVTVASDGITLDLNGFSILGPNRGEQADDLQAGIVTNGAYRDVTIKDGTVQGFSEGLVLDLSRSAIRVLTSFGRLTLRGDGNVVRDSYITDGDTGLVVRGDDNRILRNYAFGFDGEGIDVQGARNQVIGNTGESFINTGIRVSEFTDVLLKGNVGSSGVGDGIALVDGSGGVVEKNVANDNDSSVGIAVLADNLLIRKNEASRNDGHGIAVFGTGNTIQQNVANDNNPEDLSVYGIYAVAGNLDGGGNRASGNGAPQQCFGVLCR
jgi:parallel beta-helix repeat protein